MRRLSAALAALVLGLSAMACASAVELKADQIRPFDDNVITVSSEEGGLLTIEAVSGSVPLENPVTDMKIGPGTVDIPWAALTYGGEPLQTGRLTLRATLRGSDRTTEAAEIRTAVGKPVPAVVACLPASRTFYADGKNQLKIECAVSNHGAIELSIAPKADPENEVWHFKTTYSDKAPLMIRWDGRGKDRNPCPPGDYVISAWSVARGGYVQTAEVTLLSEPLPEPALALTGPLIPEDLSDDAAVWAALISPVVVGEGPEGKGLYIMADKTAGAGRIASVSCRTVGVEVLEICDDHWVKIGVWRQPDGVYTEGWVKDDKLTVIRPNTSFGAVLDKKAQTLTVYKDGKKLGTVLVSTGYITPEDRNADTHSGVYLMGARMEGFNRDGHTYHYPVRIDGSNLIHQAGFALLDGERDFTEELAALGTKASHGCIRVDPRFTEENGGINAWWIWTHMGHDCKIMITPEE